MESLLFVGFGCVVILLSALVCMINEESKQYEESARIFHESIRYRK